MATMGMASRRASSTAIVSFLGSMMKTAEGSRSRFLMPIKVCWSFSRSRSSTMTSFFGSRSYSPVSFISSSFLSREMDLRMVAKLVRVPPSQRWLT